MRDAVERIEPGTDFTVEATRGLPSREILLWRVEGDATVLVMRDLGDAVLTWDHRLDARTATWAMQRGWELFAEEVPADVAGPAYDVRCERLSLLAAALWLGWNKALDAVEHPDAATRAREEADLDWWVRQSRTALDEGVP